ncbi:MAG: PIN/TRAM domain-containing protein [Caldicoprobacterales bacterium]
MRKFFRFLLALAGIFIGFGVAFYVNMALNHFGINLIPRYQDIVLYILFALIFGTIIFLMSSGIIKHAYSLLEWVETRLGEMPISDIVAGSIGFIIGLLIAYLISYPISRLELPWVSIILTIGLYVFFGYIGVSTAVKRREELASFSLFRRFGREKAYKEDQAPASVPKVLDTSVIIDGRIFDICQTGFIEGPLIIPSFVLRELRHIADSSDTLKRNRGRRGLDILNRIQKELDIEVKTFEKDFEDIAEVDIKLLKLGQLLGAKVITNDYNLNKVAEFQGVSVLNINELANAVKPVVLPGEELVVQVIKEGKEMGQGIAYLDDGTMIVVDGGKKHVGDTIDVIVTSVLQTAAGRMIFAKPKSIERIVS